MGKQSGATVALFVILALPLLAMMGLAIDAAIVLTSYSQLERNTNNAALASMSRFLLEVDKEPADDQTQREVYVNATEIARTQAENILKLNPFLGKAFQLRREEGGPSSIGLNETGPQGIIQFGRYFVEKSLDQQVVDDCNNHFPCFLANDSSDLGITNATAVQLRVNTGEGEHSNPLVPIFGKVLGFAPTNLKVEATATRVAQNMAFLIDLSASVTGTKHLKGGILQEPVTAGCDIPNWYTNPDCSFEGSASSFAYLLDPGNSCNSFSGSQEEAINCCSDGSCLQSGGQPWTSLAGFWARQCKQRGDTLCPDKSLESYGWTSPTYEDIRTHTKSDYQKVEVNFGSEVITQQTNGVEGAPNPRVDGGGMEFLIDFASNNPDSLSAGDPCKGDGAAGSERAKYFCGAPQPLLSILRGGYGAMEYIEERAVPGDRFMFSGFDEYMYRSRLTCETSTGASSVSCPEEDLKLVHTASPDFAAFKAALAEVEGTPSQLHVPGFISQGIFPRPQNTDGPLALWDAALEMNQIATARLSKNMIFLFTDGLFNCSLNSGNFANLYGTASTMGSYLSERSCQNSGQNVWKSLDQLQTVVGPSGKTFVQSMVEAKVAVNVFLFGPGAHRLVRRSNIGAGCMKYEEAVFKNSPWIDSKISDFGCESGKECDASLDVEFRKLISGQPSNFYIQSELFNILSKPTYGLFEPILDPLKNSMGNSVKFTNQLDEVCDEVPPGEIVPDASVTVSGQTYTVTDDSGRLLYDPDGRSPSLQIRQALYRIIEGGFVLTEPENN